MSYNPAGKGDGKRPVNGETYRNNYDLIFSNRNKNKGCYNDFERECTYSNDCPECGCYRCECAVEQDPDHDRQCSHDLED
jgi:hypothetical protein